MSTSLRLYHCKSFTLKGMRGVKSYFFMLSIFVKGIITENIFLISITYTTSKQVITYLNKYKFKP